MNYFLLRRKEVINKMKIVIIICGLLAAIGGAIATIYNASAYAESNMYGEKNRAATKMKMVRLCSLMLVLGIAIFVFGCSFDIVPTGYTGVKVTMGQVSDANLSSGFILHAPFIEKIVMVNNKLIDEESDNQVWGETNEKTPVYASQIVVSYKIAASRSAWLYTYVADVNDLMDERLVASAIKSAMTELSVDNVTTRSFIEPLAMEKLNASLAEKYGDGTVVVSKLVINNMDFEDSYNEAIAAKSIAKQTQERQKIENETAIAKAEADKKVAIANAEAKAEAQRIAAQAEAEAMLIKAEAEAEANRKLAESITDEVIDNKIVDKWNGELPVVSGGSNSMLDIGELMR